MMELEENIKKLGLTVILFAAALFLKSDGVRIIRFLSLIPILLYLVFVAVFIYKKKSF
jgi:hypothetical protein